MSPTAFIIGAGGHIGLAVANKLKQEGYKVAVGSRNPLQKEGLVPITVDVSNTDSITNAFAEVKQKLGAAPNVVVFNGSCIHPHPFPNVPHIHLLLSPFTVAALTFPTTSGDPSTIDLSAVKTSADITVGLFASIQQAITGFRSLPADSPVSKTFIFTGNRVPFLPRIGPLSDLLSLGLQKVDGAYLAELFHATYEKEGFRYASLHIRADFGWLYLPNGLYRFYYADENKADGTPANLDWSETAHATAYWDAISRKERGKWYLRFDADGNALPHDLGDRL